MTPIVGDQLAQIQMAFLLAVAADGAFLWSAYFWSIYMVKNHGLVLHN